MERTNKKSTGNGQLRASGGSVSTSPAPPSSSTWTRFGPYPPAYMFQQTPLLVPENTAKEMIYHWLESTNTTEAQQGDKV